MLNVKKVGSDTSESTDTFHQTILERNKKTKFLSEKFAMN